MKFYPYIWNLPPSKSGASIALRKTLTFLFRWGTFSQANCELWLSVGTLVEFESLSSFEVDDACDWSVTTRVLWNASEKWKFNVNFEFYSRKHIKRCKNLIIDIAYKPYLLDAFSDPLVDFFDNEFFGDDVQGWRGGARYSSSDVVIWEVYNRRTDCALSKSTKSSNLTPICNLQVS